MENQTNQQTQRLNATEAQAVYDAATLEAQVVREANSRYIKLKDKEQADFVLTGVIFIDRKVFDPKQGEKTMLSFEFEEKNAKGENKQFSTSASAAVAGELLNAIKQGKPRVTMKRIGVGNKTTYMVIASPRVLQ